MKNQKSMGNKGFSLVELIIVIAIMAILVAVLAPQYLKYVEKSRNSTDAQNATEITVALQTYAADPDAEKLPVKTGSTITVDKDGISGGDDFTKAALTNAGLSSASVNCKSKTNWEKYTVKYTVADDGGLNVEYGEATFKTYMETGKVTAKKAE